MKRRFLLIFWVLNQALVLESISGSTDFSGQDLSNQNFGGKLLVGANFSQTTLNGTNFANANLAGADFTGAKAKQKAIFDNANLRTTNFSDVYFVEPSFIGAQVAGANFTRAAMHLAVFDNISVDAASTLLFSATKLFKASFKNVKLNSINVKLNGIVFNNVKLGESNFANAHLAGVVFEGCDLQAANFAQATLSSVQFNSTSLNRTSFVGANLALAKFSGIGTGFSAKGAIFDGATINNVSGLVDLLHNNQTLATGISFKGANFQKVSFDNLKLLDTVDFTGAIFGVESSFERTEFGVQVVFAKTQFKGSAFNTALVEADAWSARSYDGPKKGISFFEAQFNGANFSNAIFTYANLSRVTSAANSNFKNARFTNCKVVNSTLAGDFSCTKFDQSVVKLNSFTEAKLSGSNVTLNMEKDLDGSINSNSFPSGTTYGLPATVNQHNCM